MSVTDRLSAGEPGPVLLSHDHELLTVDVWDTLLRRRCHPDAVKLHVARFVLFQLWSYLSPPLRDSWALFRLRQQAERDIGQTSLAKGLDDEYQHRDVYFRWFELAGLSPFPSGEAGLDQFVRTLDEMELAQEKYVTYIDPGIADHLSGHSARKVLFLSDFYMSSHALKELVAYHRLHHLVDDGVVSCDIGLNKRSGKLFKYLHDQLGIDVSRHVHIGDNLHSDVHAARAHGITAIHYQPEEEHARRLRRESSFQDRSADLTHAIDECSTNRSDNEALASGAYQDGRRYSLLLVGFALHVMERALADKVDRVYFFTREGEFFLELYRRLAENSPLGCPAPDAQLLCVSRVATFSGSLKEFSTQELMRLWNQYSTQSMGALFKSLGMESSRFSDSLNRHGLSLDEPVTYPWQDARVQAFFMDEAVLGDMAMALAAKRHELMSYLASMGLGEQSGRVGIVDIGWRGTIQDNLATALPNVSLFGYYLALNRYLNVQPANSHKSAFGPNLNINEDFRSLLDFVAPLEMVCNSPNGSVTGYQMDGRNVQVLRAVDEDENRAYTTYSKDFQKGVLDAVPFWADHIRTHAYTSVEIKSHAMRLWQDMIHAPPELLARAYFDLNHNETFGVGTFHNKRQRPRLWQIWMAIISGGARKKLQNFINETGWIDGLLACPDVPRSFRFSIRFFMAIRTVRNRLRTVMGI